MQLNVRMWKKMSCWIFSLQHKLTDRKHDKWINAYLWIRNIFGVGVLSLYLRPTATTLQYNLTCAFSPSHLSVWPPLTHTDRQTNRQTHWCTHIYSSLLVKFFEGNIIHYIMQLPCNALATIQSFNSFQNEDAKWWCYWKRYYKAPQLYYWIGFFVN